MLDHLVQFEPGVTSPEGFTAFEKTPVETLLAAKVATADWLEELGATPDADVHAAAEAGAAREAFSAVALTTDEPEQRAKLIALKTPEAVRHLTGMLTAYDWDFVEQAKELRGYCVAQLVEETKNKNPNIRLKALGLLGKVTEVGLFTEKIEVKKTDMTDNELDQRIKDKLNRFMGVLDVVDVAPAAPALENPAPDA